jgi:FlaA1/EpsC-like NDP-sugar epimerase
MTENEGRELDAETRGGGDAGTRRRGEAGTGLRSVIAPTPLKRTLFYIASDIVVVVCASLPVLGSREWGVGSWQLASGITALVVCQVVLGFVTSSYRLRWSTFSLLDLPRIALPSVVTASLAAVLAGTGAITGLTWGMFAGFGVLAVRGSRRFWGELARRRTGKRAVLVVCSATSYGLLDSLRRSTNSGYRFIGIIDPESSNRNSVSQGLPVLGSFEDLEEVVRRHRVEAAFVFLSSKPAVGVGEVWQRLRELGVEVRVVPSMAHLIDNRRDIGALERLAIHELTGRPPVEVDQREMDSVFRGKRVMVTGAGGSIGSELCRQIARFNPATLVLFERDDSNLFYVELDLRTTHPKLAVVPFLGDITREADVARAFDQARPDIVFHAAAYKHVPILEFHPAEAIRVNVLGSYLVARAAVEHGAESFVYISTDKAVNPSSVMGASKRIGETVATAMNGMQAEGQMKSGKSQVEMAKFGFRTSESPLSPSPLTLRTRFLAVRFGNVLDSRGSVTTIFRRAITRREPVTVTDPEMKRYVMLTSEAVLLVMQAVALGRGGEVFVLDMGTPVKIKDLAETMIRHAGLQPGIDIPIIFTGRRPGEKLFEELLTAEEGTAATVNRRIYRARISRPRTGREILDDLGRLDEVVQSGDPQQIRAEITRQVASYHPDTNCLRGRPTCSGHSVGGEWPRQRQRQRQRRSAKLEARIPIEARIAGEDELTGDEGQPRAVPDGPSSYVRV